MAYDAGIDYQAKKNALKKQMETETDPTRRAALQNEYNAADQARMEKIAGNLGAYGKYATTNELDSAAGIAANAQVGTDYERQAQNLNKYYDQAKQNAENSALSRGMARSSYAQDRLASLDSDRAQGLSDIDATKALALQKAKAAILDNYNTTQANALSTEKKDFSNNINAYYNDFQQEINNVQGDGDSSNDWKIPILQAARNEKIAAQQKMAAKSTGEGVAAAGTTFTLAQLNTALKNIKSQHPYDDGWKSAMTNYLQSYGGNYTNALMAEWGLTPSPQPTPGAENNDLVSVPGYGNMTWDEAEKFVNSGLVVPVVGKDGNTTFVSTGKKNVNVTK